MGYSILEKQLIWHMEPKTCFG